MKTRIVVAMSLLLIFSGVFCYAENSSVAKEGYNFIPPRFVGTVPLAGKAPRTWQVTLDNTARTLDNLVVTGSGTYLGGSDNTLTPIRATISCETADTQWAYENTPTADLGHVIATGGSMEPSGPDAMSVLRGRNSADGASASCAVTLWY